jgi:hypothetical protein
VPEHLKYGGGISQTVLHPVVFITLVIAILLMIFLRRDRLLLVVLPTALLIPLGQQIVLGGLHVLVLRVIIMAGLVRAVVSGGWRPDPLDKLFVLWALAKAVAFVATFGEMGAIVNQFGFFWDTLGGYFLFRYLIQDSDDIHRAVRTLTSVSLLVAGCMLVEHVARRNVFGYLGGHPLAPTVREGKIRAQGPFAHALLAGTFGATLLPLLSWQWASKNSRILAVAGIAGCTGITVMSASSAPVLAYSAAIIGICAWPLRQSLRLLRWSVGLTILTLALVMKAPVWFLLARIDLTGSSSGYQRALLIDQFVEHFNEWWLIGTDSNNTWGWDMWDTCNQFVTEGQTGGLLTLLCFVAIILSLFIRLGRARIADRGNPDREWLFWLLGVTLWAHCVAFFGIVYFDQMRMMWYALLAILVAATADTPLVDSVIPSGQRQMQKLGTLWATSPSTAGAVGVTASQP